MKSFIKSSLFAALMLSLILSLIPYNFASAKTSLNQSSGGTNVGDFDFNTLDVGIYWYGRDNRCQKAEAGVDNPYYDPTKPTFIFIHGWEPRTDGYPKRETFNPYVYASWEDGKCIYKTTDIEIDEYTANYWIERGYNIGIFYWNQLSDEENVRDAEDKIWNAAGDTYNNDSDITGMRWKDGDGNLRTDNAPNKCVGQLFADAYISAMSDYTGSEVHIMGHSLGNQVATYGSELVNEAIAAGNASENIMIDRLTLQDPYWTLEDKSYFTGSAQNPAENCNLCITKLKAEGVAIERYDSGMLTSGGGIGLVVGADANNNGRKLMAYFDFYPDYFSNTEYSQKHCSSTAWYLASMRLGSAFTEYMSSDTSTPTGNYVAGPLMSTADLAKLMQKSIYWEQNNGRKTFTPTDDDFKQQQGNKRGTKSPITAEDPFYGYDIVSQDSDSIKIKCNYISTNDDISRFVAYINGQRFLSGRKGTDDYQYITITGLDASTDYSLELKSISTSGWEGDMTTLTEEEAEELGVTPSSNSSTITTEPALSIEDATVRGSGKVNDEMTMTLSVSADNKDKLKYSFYVYDSSDTLVSSNVDIAGSSSSYTPTNADTYNIKMVVTDTEYNRTREITKSYEVSNHDYAEPTYTWAQDYSSCTASRICTDDASHSETETVITFVISHTANTCETDGSISYKAVFENSAFANQIATKTLKATGHIYNDPIYTWSSDYSTCTATKMCANDSSHIISETVETTCLTTKPTCTSDGSSKYTANFINEDFQTQEQTIILSATGHSYSTPKYTWSKDYSTCTATRTCKNNASHIEKETVSTTISSKVEASTTKAGNITYKAKFKNSAFTSQSKTVSTGLKKETSTVDTSQVPSQTSLKSLKIKRHKLIVKWKKVTSVSGYQIQFSTNKKFKKKVTTKTIKKASKSKVKIKLKSKKKRTYYVRIRTFSKDGQKTIYSSWSKVKKRR